MGLEGVNPSHHTLPTPMGQSQSTAAREPDGEERARLQQQQQQTVGEKNNVIANGTPAISVCPGNLNINSLSGSNNGTFNNNRVTSSPALPPAASAQVSTPVSRTQVNGNENFKPGNGHYRMVERIPWPPAKPISPGPTMQANGTGKAPAANANTPRRVVEFIPFEPQKAIQRGARNTDTGPTPRPLQSPQPQTNITSSTTTAATAGTVIQPPTVNTSLTAPTPQPKTPILNGSANQSNMVRPKTTTTAVSIPNNPSAPLNSTVPTIALVTTPLAPVIPTATPIAKDTATSTPKLKRKASSAPRGGGTKRGRKRKSTKFDDDEDVIRVGDTSTSSDESDNPTPVTTMTKSGRQVNRPTAFVPPPEPVQEQEAAASPVAGQEKNQPQRKKRRTYRKGRESNVTCVRCWRGHSPTSNAIVFCDECNGAWHQFCHDPPIANEVIVVQEAQWFCRECRPVQNGAVPQRLQDRPVPNEVFPVASQVLVGGQKFTPDQRRGYLAGLSHAALVKLLYDISNSQPELAIFPENMLDLPSAAVLPPPPRPRVSKASLDLSTTAPTTTTTSIPTTTTPALPPAQPANTEQPTSAAAATAAATAAPSVPPPQPKPQTTLSTYEIEIEDQPLSADHRLYPRAGNGFHLPPDAADLDMLLEDPSCTTFSHALHARAKVKAKPMGEVEGSGAQMRTSVVGGVA